MVSYNIRIIVLVSVATTVLMAIGAIGLGSAPGNSSYLHRTVPPVLLITLIMISIPILVQSIRWSWAAILKNEKSVVAFWIALGLLLHLGIRLLGPFPLSEVVADDGAFSFLQPAQSYSSAELLSSYPDIREDLPHHAGRNLPGKTVFVQALLLVTKSPGGIAFLITVIAVLNALVVYIISKQLTSNKQSALAALVLTITIPSLIGYTPLLNAVSPLVLLVPLLLVAWYLRAPHWWIAAVCGASVYIGMLFEPLPLVGLIVPAALLIHATAKKRLSLTAFWRFVWIGAGGFVMVYGLCILVFAYHLFESLGYALADAQRFNIQAMRPYGIWIIQNLKDFSYAGGTALVALFLTAVVRALSQVIQKHPIRTGEVVPLALFCLILFLDILGINRGETPRLWIFLMALLPISVAPLIRRGADLALVSALVIAQSIVMVSSFKLI